MSQRQTYTVEVAGLTRHLPLFEVAPGVRIAVFNMLGDTYVAKAAAAALAERGLRDERSHGPALRRIAQIVQELHG